MEKTELGVSTPFTKNVFSKNNSWTIIDGKVKHYDGTCNDAIMVPEGVTEVDLNNFYISGYSFIHKLILPKTVKKLIFSKYLEIRSLTLWDNVEISKFTKNPGSLQELVIINTGNTTLDFVTKILKATNSFYDIEMFRVINGDTIPQKEWLKICQLLPHNTLIYKTKLLGDTDYLIEGDTLIKAFSNSTDFLVPEGIKKVNDEAFIADGLMDYSLTTRDDVTISKSALLIKYIRYLKVINTGNIMEFLRTFANLSSYLNGPQELIVVGKPLTFKEKMEIYRLFKRVIKIRNQSLEEFNEQHMPKIQKPYTEESISDTVSTLIKKIKDIIKILPEVEREKINHQVDNLVQNYKQQIYQLNPDLTFIQKEPLQLYSDPISLKNKLISDLEVILHSLTIAEELKAFMQKIDNCLVYPQTTPTAFDSIDSKITFVRQTKSLPIRIEFESIINEIKESLNNNSISLDEKMNKKQDFENKLEELFQMAQKYNFISELLAGKETTSEDEIVKQFSADIIVLRRIIAELDDENKQKYYSKLNDININLDILKTKSIAEIILIIRGLMANILEELKLIVTNLTSFKDILNELNNCLKRIDDNISQAENNTELESLIESIMVSLANISNYEIKEGYVEKTKYCLINWKEKILATSCEAILEECYCPKSDDDFSRNLLSTKNIVIVSILKELYGIYFEINDYKSRKSNYEEAMKI